MLKFIFILTLLCSSCAASIPPNVILFLADDMGYGDLSSYGHPTQESGPIDELARGGVKFTQAYSQGTFCTPSRAAMLTGRQPFRSGMRGSLQVILHHHFIGLPHEELTLPEILKQQGYTTGMVGKWHQGSNRVTRTDGYYLPHNQGFDFVGTFLPFTLVSTCDTEKRHMKRSDYQRCFVYRNRTIIQQPINFNELSPVLLADAQAFLYDAKKPFFLYYSFPQVHTPMFNMNRFAGESRRGIYGDQIAEMQWAVGEVLTTLERIGVRNNTLVLFASDHGPHIEMGLEGGSAGMFKGGKSNFYEGGIRIPFIANWPSVIPANSVNHNVISLMDLLPTMYSLTKSAPPEDLVLDGESFFHFLKLDLVTYNQSNSSFSTKDAIIDASKTPRFLPFFCGNLLMAVRYGPYKLHFRLQSVVNERAMLMHTHNGYPFRDWFWNGDCADSTVLEEPVLYNIEHDPSEILTLNIKDFSHIVENIHKKVEEYLNTIKNIPEPLFERKYFSRKTIPCCNPPYCMCFDSLWKYLVCPI